MTEVTMALSPSSVSIGRDADGGYTITVPVETKTESPGINPAVRTLLFAANTRFSTPALPKLAYYAARQDASSTGEKGGDRYLTLSNPDGFAHMTFAEISLCNTSSGKGCGVPLGSPVPGKIMLVFGQATPLADVPLGGSASYHGLFDLAAMDGDRLSGNLMISLDFGQRTATGSLTHVERYWNACDAQGCVMPYSDIGLTGSLATDGTLGGTVTPSSEITSGTWSGRFFGPGSAELGGSMLMQGKSAGWSGFTIFGGVFGAKKQ
jgi:hypothetical protein